eukprot:TRINITY_DN61828_c0_g1_i1.p1 TRINITY_DN61828_c0_g1~~TRINITY_DN61828_c0_g1_i1.p1  ORF type:complete len:761 (+),score=130.50 TRINITY_DN61828_c0_g1_i1:110-2392(+)
MEDSPEFAEGSSDRTQQEAELQLPRTSNIQDAPVPDNSPDLSYGARKVTLLERQPEEDQRHVLIAINEMRQQLEDTIKLAITKHMREPVDLIRDAGKQMTALLSKLQTETLNQSLSASESKQPLCRSTEGRHFATESPLQHPRSNSHGHVRSQQPPSSSRGFSHPVIGATKKNRPSFRSLEDQLNRDLVYAASFRSAPRMAAQTKDDRLIPESQGPLVDSAQLGANPVESPQMEQRALPEQRQAQPALAHDSAFLAHEDSTENLIAERGGQHISAACLSIVPGTIRQEHQPERPDSEPAGCRSRNGDTYRRGESETHDMRPHSIGLSRACSNRNGITDLQDLRAESIGSSLPLSLQRRPSHKLSKLREERQSELTRSIMQEKLQKGKHGSLASDDSSHEELHKGCLKKRLTSICDRVGDRLAGVLNFIAGSKDVSTQGMCSLFVHFLVLLAGILAVLVNFESWRRQQHSDVLEDQRAGLPFLLVDLAVGAGAVCGLLACRCARASSDQLSCDKLIMAFAEQKEFSEELKQRQGWVACGLMACWLLAVAERLREAFFRMPLESQWDLQVFIFVMSFAISGGLLMALLFSFLRICLSLQLMVDEFSFHLVDSADFNAAAEEWNVIQALIRSSCTSSQYQFLALHATIVAALILGCFDFYTSHGCLTAFIGPAILLAKVAQVFLRASTLTDHCERLPSFVNSLSEQAFDWDTMYLVEYILYSNAGFHLFEARLTSGKVLKAFYFLLVALFTFATNIMLEGGQQ